MIEKEVYTLIKNWIHRISLIGNPSFMSDSKSQSENVSPQELSPNKPYVSFIVQSSEDKRQKSPSKPQMKLVMPDNIIFTSSISNNICKCIELADSECSFFANTPLVVRWGIDNYFKATNIFRVIWNVKDVEIITLKCKICKNLINSGIINI